MKKYAVFGLIAAVSILIPSLIVFADEYPEEVDYEIVDYKVTGNGGAWIISTINPVTGLPYFSGKDVTGIKAWYSQDGKLSWNLLPPEAITKIRLTDDQIRVQFNKKLLPEWATDTSITGNVGIETFRAQGPGFWLRRRP